MIFYLIKIWSSNKGKNGIKSTAEILTGLSKRQSLYLQAQVLQALCKLQHGLSEKDFTMILWFC